MKFIWKITEIRDRYGSEYGYISIRVWDGFEGFGGLRIGAGEDVFISLDADPYCDEVDEGSREHRLLRDYWRSIGSPEATAGEWFPWKAAGFTPEYAGKMWKVANFSPGSAVEAWTASGFSL